MERYDRLNHRYSLGWSQHNIFTDSFHVSSLTCTDITANADKYFSSRFSHEISRCMRPVMFQISERLCKSRARDSKEKSVWRTRVENSKWDFGGQMFSIILRKKPWIYNADSGCYHTWQCCCHNPSMSLSLLPAFFFWYLFERLTNIFFHTILYDLCSCRSFRAQPKSRSDAKFWPVKKTSWSGWEINSFLFAYVWYNLSSVGCYFESANIFLSRFFVCGEQREKKIMQCVGLKRSQNLSWIKN